MVILFISQYIRVKWIVTPEECSAKLMYPGMIKHTPASQQIHSYKQLCPLLKHSVNQLVWGWAVCRRFRGQEHKCEKSTLHMSSPPSHTCITTSLYSHSDVSAPPFCSWYEPWSTENALLINGSRRFKMTSSNTVSRGFRQLRIYWHQCCIVSVGILYPFLIQHQVFIPQLHIF